MVLLSWINVEYGLDSHIKIPGNLEIARDQELAD